MAELERKQRILQQVTFETAYWAHPGRPPGFSCLMDADGFNLTGGVQKVNIVDRPRQTGIPVFAGFDPLTATVPLLIDALSSTGAVNWVNSVDGGVCENIYATLLWMAGRGLPINGVPPLVGQTPQNVSTVGPAGVHVKTVDAQGYTTQLIPAQFQWEAKNHTPPLWMVTGIDRASEILRIVNGWPKRVQLRLNVTLTQQIADKNAGTATGRFGNTIGWHKYTVSHPNINTAAQIVQKYMNAPIADRQATAKAIINYSKNSHLHLHSVNEKISPVVNGKIKKPKTIWVPKTPMTR